MKKIIIVASVLILGNLFAAKSILAAVIFQDDFENGISNWELKHGNVSITNEKVHSGNKSVRVDYDTTANPGTATHIFSQPISGRIGIWMYDDLNLPNGNYTYLSLTDSGYTKGISIGIRPATSQVNYTYCPTENQNGCMNTGILRTTGWHQFGISVTPKGAYGIIDNQALSYLPANTVNHAVNVGFTQFQRVNIGVQGNGGQGNVYFDNVYIDDFPPPPSNEEIANDQIKLFLQTYPVIDVSNLDHLIKAREADFCSVDTQPCPDGSGKEPHWYFNEQLFHYYEALLYTAGAHEVNYLKNNQAASLQKAIEIVSYVDGEYGRWKQNNSGSIVGSYLTLDSWFIWPHLPTSLQQSIRTHMLADGEYLRTHSTYYSSYIGDSSGENNLWPGTYLTYISLAFRDMPQAQTWTDRARFFAFHALTKNETYGGFTSRTIYDDNMFDNHNYHPNPQYGNGTAATLALMEYLSKKVIGSSPAEFSHNALPVWQKMKEYIDFRDFSYKGAKIVRIDGEPNVFVPSGQNDWGGDAFNPLQVKAMKEIYGDNSISDPETGFSTNDLYTHEMQYLYYIHNGYLAKYTPANTQLTEMVIDNDATHMATSYIWWQNASRVWAFVYTALLFDPNFTFPSTAPQPPPTGTLSCPSQIELGQSGTVALHGSDSSGDLQKAQLYFSPSSPTNPNGDWTKIGADISCTGAACAPTVSWTPGTTGAYVLTANYFNTNGEQCSGNPWITYPASGFSACATPISNDSCTITVTPIPGDITETGDAPGDHVNNNDFLKMKSEFVTHPYTIFDYNTLVANYGH